MYPEYQVTTEVFEGPLDVLLSLVEKRKLFINDIALSRVADDFISHTSTLENMPMRDATHFLVIAATLVLIKSKSLLPALSLTEEEKESIEDLQERLRQHKIFLELSLSVDSMFGTNISFSRMNRSKEIKPVFAPDSTVTPDGVYAAVMDAITQVPKKESQVEARVEKIISLKEVIDTVSERVRAHMSMSFKDMCGSTTTREQKAGAVVNFLAVLELVKQGTILVRQETTFADIELKNHDQSTLAGEVV